MKSFLKKIFVLLFVAAFAFSCESSHDALVEDRLEDNPAPSEEPLSGDSGSADFSNYVAIGNSLTAGFMDGALYNMGQENSLAALLAQQLTYADAPETFNQPDINSEVGYNSSASDPQNSVILGRYKLNTDSTAGPVGPLPTKDGELPADYNGDTSDLNNFGVPGILVGQLLTPATGGPNDPSNPAYSRMYERFASNPSQDGSTGSTILSDAIATEPTFFTLWIGNNDVLGYAVSGASGNPPMTDVATFENQFKTVVDSLMERTDASGVVATIPPLLNVPYFRAISHDAVPLDQETADQLNAAYQDYNDGVTQAETGGAISPEEAERRQIEFSAGNNAFVIVDESLTDVPNLPKYRQAEPTDLMVLPLGSLLGSDLGNGAYGLEDPVSDQHVLIPEEQQEIETVRAQFNQIIEEAEDNNNIVLYDTNNPNGAFTDLFGYDSGQFQEEDVGMRINGQLLQPDFTPNGVFSTDGIHPNARGNAILANEIIEVIENNFGASIPEVDVLALPSVQVCAGDCASQQQEKQLIGSIDYNISAVR